MPKELRIIIDKDDDQRRFAWISLRDDFSISIGLSDRSVRVQHLTSQSENDRTKLEVVHEIAEPLNNPHMTFHPPHYVHLTDSRSDPVYEGLTWTDHAPWIRFISSPIHNLRPIGQNRHGQPSTTMKLQARTFDASAQLLVDFVSRVPLATLDPKIYRVIAWGDVSIAVCALLVPPQLPSLGFVFSG